MPFRTGRGNAQIIPLNGGRQPYVRFRSQLLSMLAIIDSVGHLTDLCERDDLEITLASVMFDLVAPTRLTLWRLVRHGETLRIRMRAELTPRQRAPITDLNTETKDLPALEEIEHLRSCYDSRAPHLTKAGKTRACCHVFPVMSERDVIGLLEIEHPVALRAYEERVVSGLLRIYRNHLKVLDYSEYDELTGLLNRKTFDDCFGRLQSPTAAAKIGGFSPERRRPLDPDECLWLAVIDVDFFKSINDRFGHLYGDEVLVLLSRIMRSSFREVDRLFRFGGEEFVVMLGNTTQDFAEQTLDRCRAAVEAFEFPQVGRVTVSIGFTCITPGDSGSNAFGRADQALYLAKQNGRNQVRCYETVMAAGLIKSSAPSTGSVELF